MESKEAVIKLLSEGVMEALGTMPWGSNYTFLVQISAPPSSDYQLTETLAVYKPRRGEAPLWDFPTGTLCLREFAAYLVSEALNWEIVPPTVLRHGTYGFGSVQLFIDSDPNQHFFTFRNDASACERLKQIALFDLITNNADRKSGHCLRDHEGRVWAIDHGICFNAEYKLRTVIWEFAGQPIPLHLLDDLRRLQIQVRPDQALGKTLRRLLDEAEIAAFEKRIATILRIGVYPMPNRYERSIPWPPV